MVFKLKYNNTVLEKNAIFCFINFILVIWLVIIQTSCKKLVDPNAPKTSVSQANAFDKDASAISVLNGLYYQMSSNNYFAGDNGISMMAGLSADEFSLSTAVSSSDTKSYFYIDSLYSNSNGTKAVGYWSELYNLVFRCNAAIEGLEASENLTSSIKQQLLGEALFVRSLCYFFLVNLYGDAPLVTSSDWKINLQMERTSKDEVYRQIIEDLKTAQDHLSDKYLNANLISYNSSPERVRPTRWAATALLARVYLYEAEWANAESEATKVINNSTLYNLVDLKTVFLKNSAEAIWQLQPVTSGRNTSDGALFLLTSNGPTSDNPVYLSPQLLASFEGGDQRRYSRKWVDSITVGSTNYYFPFKYKVGFNSNISAVPDLTEYLMVLRLAEQYLIRAEARAQQSNPHGAIADLDAIRLRAGIAAYSGLTAQAPLLSAILHERQVELFTEFGHRWFDLKRTGNINTVMSSVRPFKANGGFWQPWMQLYPIPFEDVKKNPSLLQNEGY